MQNEIDQAIYEAACKAGVQEKPKPYLEILNKAGIIQNMILCNRILELFKELDSVEFDFELEDIYDEDELKAGKNYYSFLEEEVMQIYFINDHFNRHITQKYGIYTGHIPFLDVNLLFVDFVGTSWELVKKDPSNSFKV